MLYLGESLEEEVCVLSETLDHRIVEPIVIVRQVPMENSDGWSDPFHNQSGNDLLIESNSLQIRSVNTIVPLREDSRPSYGHPERVEAVLVKALDVLTPPAVELDRPVPCLI